VFDGKRIQWDMVGPQPVREIAVGEQADDEVSQ
jgi:hypothetical protein